MNFDNLKVYIYNGSNINCYDLYQGDLLFIYQGPSPFTNY